METLKEAYWTYFTSNHFRRPFGCTDKRLAKIKPIVMTDQHFWNDIFRHGCDRFSNPEEYHGNIDKETFEHCLGNFQGMLMSYMYQYGLIKK